jgi:hypothetical protein
MCYVIYERPLIYLFLNTVKISVKSNVISTDYEFIVMLLTFSTPNIIDRLFTRKIDKKIAFKLINELLIQEIFFPTLIIQKSTTFCYSNFIIR